MEVGLARIGTSPPAIEASPTVPASWTPTMTDRKVIHDRHAESSDETVVTDIEINVTSSSGGEQAPAGNRASHPPAECASGCTPFVARRKPPENREDMRMLRKMLSPYVWRKRGLIESKKTEPQELAVMIRELAVDAHRALQDPFVTAAKLADLSRRIKELRKSTRSARLSEIDCWLHQVQRRVEERWPAARLTTRT
jgi:hypothetical protein